MNIKDLKQSPDYFPNDINKSIQATILDAYHQQKANQRMQRTLSHGINPIDMKTVDENNQHPRLSDNLKVGQDNLDKLAPIANEYEKTPAGLQEVKKINGQFNIKHVINTPFVRKTMNKFYQDLKNKPINQAMKDNPKIVNDLNMESGQALKKSNFKQKDVKGEVLRNNQLYDLGYYGDVISMSQSDIKSRIEQGHKILHSYYQHTMSNTQLKHFANQKMLQLGDNMHLNTENMFGNPKKVKPEKAKYLNWLKIKDTAMANEVSLHNDKHAKPLNVKRIELLNDNYLKVVAKHDKRNFRQVKASINKHRRQLHEPKIWNAHQINHYASRMLSKDLNYGGQSKAIKKQSKNMLKLQVATDYVYHDGVKAYARDVRNGSLNKALNNMSQRDKNIFSHTDNPDVDARLFYTSHRISLTQEALKPKQILHREFSKDVANEQGKPKAIRKKQMNKQQSKDTAIAMKRGQNGRQR